MSVQSLSQMRICIGLFFTSESGSSLVPRDKENFFADQRPHHTAFLLSAAQAAVPASTYVGRGTSPDPENNITVSINVPNDNSDSLFFHFSAPAAQTWAAFGLGGQMAGTLIFVTYASEDNKNVTVSPRIATGHVMPQHTDDVQVEVLSGSGIIDGSYVVNARCSKCRSWDGGKINVDSTNQAMIWAAGPAGILNSDDANAQISKHEGYNFFKLDLKAATGAGGVPIVNSTTDAVVGGGPDDDDDHFRRGATGFHGFLMAAAFLIVFPGGYLLLRVFEKVWLHWGVQSLALLMIVLGMGVGIAISKKDNIVSNVLPPNSICLRLTPYSLLT